MLVREAAWQGSEDEGLIIGSSDVEKQLAEEGLKLPPGYVWCSEGEMRARRYGGVGGEWCEGRVVQYCRTINGRKVLNDLCTVVLSADGISGFSLMHHLLEGELEQNIKDVEFLSGGTVDGEELQKEIAYIVQDRKAVPVWVISIGDVAFLYDARTGGEL
jgi:hypothetical protein